MLGFQGIWEAFGRNERQTRFLGEIIWEEFGMKDKFGNSGLFPNLSKFFVFSEVLRSHLTPTSCSQLASIPY
jgi:hypothetical protein